MIDHSCKASVRAAVSRLRVTRRALGLAQAAGVALLLTHAGVAGAESFGRWFFSAEERRVLDELRDAGEAPKPAPAPSGEKPVAPVVDVISFDGKVERSDGSSTIWVNGRPVVTGNTTAEGIRVQPSRGTSGETRFVLPPSDTGATRFSLRAGQKIAVQNGRKFDAFEIRPGEDAASVFESREPVDSGNPDGGAESRRDDDTPAPRRTSPGS